MQMSPESGDDRSPSPEIRLACLAGSGENCRIPVGHLRAGSDPAGSGQIRPDSGHFGQIQSYPAGFRSCWPDPAGSVSGSGQIRPDSGRFLSMTGFRPDSAGIRRSCRMLPDSGGRRFSSGQIPAAGSILVVGFRRRHYSSDLMMPDSSAAYFRTTDYCRIQPVKYQTCV
jgi:hypothetical protein